MNMHMKTDRLTAFLYLLTRDHLASGVIEKLLVTVEGMNEPTTTYSCPHLAALAAEWADRLTQAHSFCKSQVWDNGDMTTCGKPSTTVTFCEEHWRKP